MDEEFLCEGDWDSFIDGDDDGFFSLDFDEDTGDITGEHIVKEEGEEKHYEVWGTCQHPTPQSPVHFITLFEPRDGYAYRYRGVIVPDTSGEQEHRVPAGKRRKLQRIELREEQEKRERKDRLPDNDWTAERTT